MTKNEFRVLLEKSSILALDFAKEYVSNELPNTFKYRLLLNISHDNPALKQFDIFPEDNGKIFELISKEEVVEILYRNGKVPVWIDINVDTVYKNNTILALLCAGRYASDIHEYYYNRNNTGPLGIKSPYFPTGYEKGVLFSLKEKYKTTFFGKAKRMAAYIK